MSTATQPRIGDRFNVTCHDTHGALVTTTVTATDITPSVVFPGRYRVTATRPGAPEGECQTLAFVVDKNGREIEARS